MEFLALAVFILASQGALFVLLKKELLKKEMSLTVLASPPKKEAPNADELAFKMKEM